MTIESPDTLSEFAEWIDDQVSTFTDNDGWAESVYSLTLNDARGYIEMFCPERIDLIPQPHFASCVSDEILERYRQTTIDRLQKLSKSIQGSGDHSQDDERNRTMMTEPLTLSEIASLFSVNRNDAHTVLEKYDHETVRKKYRLPIKVMPPDYFSKRGIDPNSYR